MATSPSAIVTRQLVKKRLETLHRPGRAASGTSQNDFGSSATAGKQEPVNTEAPMDWDIGNPAQYKPREDALVAPQNPRDSEALNDLGLD